MVSSAATRMLHGLANLRWMVNCTVIYISICVLVSAGELALSVAKFLFSLSVANFTAWKDAVRGGISLARKRESLLSHSISLNDDRSTSFSGWHHNYEQCTTDPANSKLNFWVLFGSTNWQEPSIMSYIASLSWVLPTVAMHCSYDHGWELHFDHWTTANQIGNV